MAEKTNAVRQLARTGGAYTLHSYETDGSLAGVDVAAQLHLAPERVFKTLVTVGRSGAHYVFMIPVAAELDLKKAATLAGEKSIEMVKSKSLLVLTGYIHGGCSPIGMKKQFPTFLHESALQFDTIFFSAGKIGLQIETAPATLALAVPIETAALI